MSIKLNELNESERHIIINKGTDPRSPVSIIIFFHQACISVASAMRLYINLMTNFSPVVVGQVLMTK